VLTRRGAFEKEPCRRLYSAVRSAKRLAMESRGMLK
jgi:hypothetical protein